MSQHAFNGHGFKLARSCPSVGASVPGTWGPQMALATELGIGGSPELIHIFVPCHKVPHPFHPTSPRERWKGHYLRRKLNLPHVFLLNSSRSSKVMELAVAIDLQLSSTITVYVAHEPSGLGLGRKSGRVPAEQQTCCPGCRLEHKLDCVLYFSKSAPDTPHLFASVPQLSPSNTLMVEHSARRCRVGLLAFRTRGLRLKAVVGIIALWNEVTPAMGDMGVTHLPCDQVRTVSWTVDILAEKDTMMPQTS